MMATEARTVNYWISDTALTIQLNALGDPAYAQCGVMSGAYILCYMQGIEGLGYDAGHNYQRWELEAFPSMFPDNGKKYVYVAIPRSSNTNHGKATLVFPGQQIDIYGMSIPESEEENAQQIGSTDYYYIFLQGIISAVQTSNGTRMRDWEQHVDCGSLASDEALATGGDGTWWKYNTITDTVTFLKTILKATFDELTAKVAKVTKLTLGGKDLTGVADEDTLRTSTDKVVTPSYLDQFGAKHYLRRDKDDTAEGVITFLKGIQAKATSNIEQLTSDKIAVGDKFTFDKSQPFKFDANGNIVAHSVSSDNYDEGREQGFTIAVKDVETGKYKLNLDELTAWGIATLGQLHVKGDSVFDGTLSSPSFISGFLDGKGWRLKNQPITNAAGVQENKYTMELDNLIVRGTMRVYEMIISQLLGENDNRIFTAMLEVDHYDEESGKVYLDTQEGRMYNPFRKGDYIMVQQYNGMPSDENDHYVTKRYELLVTEVGSEGEGEKMLAWVRFKNFTSTMEGATASSLIKKKDTFVRVDNVSDPDRKGIIQMMTVGSDTPYMDIIYGLKTDPDNALKGRLGNLQGIVHPLFGSLSGFGEYLQNLYATGDFVLRRTGESVDTKIQMLQDQFATRFAQTSYEITEETNYLHNGQFLTVSGEDDGETIDGWTVDSTDETAFWVDADGLPVLVNDAVTTSGIKRVSIDNVEGRTTLRIQNCGLTQANSLIKQPGTHKEYEEPTDNGSTDTLSSTSSGYKEVQDKLYITALVYTRTAGTLTMGFQGCTAVDGKTNELAAQDFSLAYSAEWVKVKMEGKWNGTGSFRLAYTGDLLVSMVTITDVPLDNLSKTVSTQIIQTAKNIKLLGENDDKLNRKNVQLGLDLDAANERITQYVSQAQTKEEAQKQVDALTTDIQKNIQDAKDYADGIGNGCRSEYKNACTTVYQNADSWGVAAGAFDSDGKLRETAGAVLSTNFAKMYAKEVAADGTIVKTADMGVYVTKDEDNNVITNATINADDINLSAARKLNLTTGTFTVSSTNFTLNESGDVWMKGKVEATDGTFKGKVYATDGEFTGKITATNSSFSGAIEATSGTFGVWSINKNEGCIEAFSSNGNVQLGKGWARFRGSTSPQRYCSISTEGGSNSIILDCCGDSQTNIVIKASTRSVYGATGVDVSAGGGGTGINVASGGGGTGIDVESSSGVGIDIENCATAINIDTNGGDVAGLRLPVTTANKNVTAGSNGSEMVFVSGNGITITLDTPGAKNKGAAVIIVPLFNYNYTIKGKINIRGTSKDTVDVGPANHICVCDGSTWSVCYAPFDD